MRVFCSAEIGGIESMEVGVCLPFIFNINKKYSHNSTKQQQ